MIPFIQRLPANTAGRDLIVGDLHGCYDHLWMLLEHVKYDHTKDRVFLVGDLVDRGPNSLECLDLVRLPGVYSLLGNHEDMMFRSIINGDGRQFDMWMNNGGIWAEKFTDRTLSGMYSGAFQTKLEQLGPLFPHMIVVGEGADRFNLVHADIFSHRRPLCDADIDKWEFSPEEHMSMIWGRTVIKYYGNDDALFHYNMSPTYCGHTVVQSVVTVQSQIFIDTGCVYAWSNSQYYTANHGLTLVSHQDQKYFTVLPRQNNRIVTYDLPPILN